MVLAADKSLFHYRVHCEGEIRIDGSILGEVVQQIGGMTQVLAYILDRHKLTEDAVSSVSMGWKK